MLGTLARMCFGMATSQIGVLAFGSHLWIPGSHSRPWKQQEMAQGEGILLPSGRPGLGSPGSGF